MILLIQTHANKEIFNPHVYDFGITTPEFRAFWF